MLLKLVVLILCFTTQALRVLADKVYIYASSTKNIKAIIPDNIENTQLGLKINISDPNEDGTEDLTDSSKNTSEDTKDDGELIFRVYETSGNEDEIIKFRMYDTDHNKTICPLGSKDLSIQGNITISIESSLPYDKQIHFELFECSTAPLNSELTTAIAVFAIIIILFVGVWILWRYGYFGDSSEYFGCAYFGDSSEESSNSPVNIPLMKINIPDEFIGEFKFEKSEGFIATMEELGMEKPEDIYLKKDNEVKQIIEQNGSQVTIILKTYVWQNYIQRWGEPKVWKHEVFQLNSPFEETTMDGRKSDTTATIEEDKLVKKQIPQDFSKHTTTETREMIHSVTMKVTVEIKDKPEHFCEFIYKKNVPT